MVKKYNSSNRPDQYKKGKRGNRQAPVLTIGQRKVVENINRGMTPTKSVMRAYNIEKPTQAGATWAALKKKPHVQSALLAYSSLAEDTIIDAITDYKSSDVQWQRSLAVDTSKWLHDKVHGKAAQQNTNVNLNFTAHATEKKDKYGL